MFYVNFVKLCNEINKAPSAVAEEIGLKKSAVTKWKKGANPTDATKQKLADYFDVTVDYLLGKTDTKKSPSIAERDFDSMIEDIAAGGEDHEGVIMAKGGKGQKRIIITENDDEADFAAEAIRLFRRSQKKK